MGFAAFLDLKKETKDPDLLEFSNLKEEQRSDVFMNSLIVTLIQFFCVYLVWGYALNSPKFVMNPASSFQLIVARFLASMLMHL
jgi:ABC-type thiamin/hydroxymethylpyrimidine transport system permease subunit